MKTFLLNLCVLTAVAGISAYMLAQYVLTGKYFQPGSISGLISPLGIYFFFITAAGHYLLIKPGRQNSNSGFVNKYLMVSVLKFFLSIATLIVYSIFNAETAVDFIALFAYFYLLFGGFEVISLMKYFKGTANG